MQEPPDMDIRLGYEPAAIAEAPMSTMTDRAFREQRPCASASPDKTGELIALPRELFERLLSLARVVDPRFDVEENLMSWPPRTRKGSRAPTVAMARKFYQMRRRRAAYFDPMLFAEPAWDMLLDLYIAEREGRAVAVLSACIGAAAPQTTALRWMRVLEEHGLIRKETDSKDARRIYVRLTEAAIGRMRSLLRESQMIVESDRGR
jgi:DNA-binding transcriptional ArsR family regulator